MTQVEAVPTGSAGEVVGAMLGSVVFVVSFVVDWLVGLAVALVLAVVVVTAWVVIPAYGRIRADARGMRDPL